MQVDEARNKFQRHLNNYPVTKIENQIDSVELISLQCQSSFQTKLQETLAKFEENIVLSSGTRSLSTGLLAQADVADRMIDKYFDQ